MLRPVLVCLSLSGVGLTTASCGMVDGDPHRFESLAQKVADIRLDGSEASVSAPLAASAPAPTPLTGTAAASGLRSALRVEVMDPHDLWDARDGLRHAIREESTAVVEAAAPAVAHGAMSAVVQQVSTRAADVARPVRTDGLRSGLSTARTTIQLGAYSSEAAARSAWTTVKAGAARHALTGLSPVFERVTVNGRALTRLKVAAPTAAAVAICRAAQVSDPWCARQA